MNIKTIVLVGMAVLTGKSALAQEYPKVEIPIDYSYARGNPANVGKPFSLNGAGGGLVYNFNRFIGFKADFQGYGSTTSTFTNVPIVTPQGPVVGTVSASGNLFTYLFGPQIRIPTHFVKPFGEVLVGGATSNLYKNLFTAAGSFGSTPGNNAFAMAVGGGFDIRLSKMVYIRPFQMDYLLTRFGNSVIPGGAHNQNNFRFQAGVVLTFGE